MYRSTSCQVRKKPTFGLVLNMAFAGGFEPPVRHSRTPAFQAGSFSLSDKRTGKRQMTLNYLVVRPMRLELTSC